MTAGERVMNTLAEGPQPVCDDCLRRPANLVSRDVARKVCRSLWERQGIARDKGRCAVCGKTSVVNGLIRA